MRAFLSTVSQCVSRGWPRGRWEQMLSCLNARGKMDRALSTGLLRAFATGWAPHASAGRQRERCFRPVLGHCTHLPGLLSQVSTSWVAETGDMYSLTVREAEVQNQGVGGARLPPQALGEGPPRLFQLLGFMDCGHMAPTSASTPHGHRPLCPCVSLCPNFPLLTSLWIRARPTPV